MRAGARSRSHLPSDASGPAEPVSKEGTAREGRSQDESQSLANRMERQPSSRRSTDGNLRLESSRAGARTHRQMLQSVPKASSAGPSRGAHFGDKPAYGNDSVHSPEEGWKSSYMLPLFLAAHFDVETE